MKLWVPDVEEATDDDEFAEVVGVVVGDEKGFAEEVLAFAPAEGFVEVDVGFGEEGFEGALVGADGGDGVGPGMGVGRRGGFGPVVIGPGDVFVAAGGRGAELEDVALGDAEVFEDLPGGVWQVSGDGAVMFGGEVFDGGVEVGVGLAAGEQGEKLLDELGVRGFVGFFGGHRCSCGGLDAAKPSKDQGFIL